MVRALIVALALAAAGCVSVQPAPLSSAEGRAEVNARAVGAVAVVRVVGGRGEEVRALRVGPDSTTWVDRWSGRPTSVPTAEVASVSFRESRVVRGLTVGVAAGALLGLVASTGDEGSGWLVRLPTWFWVAGGAVNGALVGFGAGAVATQNDVYRPAPPEAAPPRAAVGEPCGGPPLACAAPPRNTAGGVGEGPGR